MTEDGRQRTDDREDRLLNSEVGMRPPAHRGRGLRPGGKSESNRDRRQRTEAE
jgi:hypothetical protein